MWILRVYHSRAAVAAPRVSPSPSILSRFLPGDATQVHTCTVVLGTNSGRNIAVQTGRQARPFMCVRAISNRQRATSSTVMQIGNPPTQLHRCSPNHACTEAHAAINVPTASNSSDDEDDAVIEVH